MGALRTEDLSKSYRGRKVVDKVSVSLDPGEVVGLLGPNGAGKTTSFRMIVGLISPDSGRVFFNDQDITTTPMYQRARLGISYLPQEASIFRKLTVEENLLAILQTLKLSKRERLEKVDDLTVRFNLTRPEAPFIANLAMDFASILSAQYGRRMLAAGTSEKVDLDPVGTGPFQLVAFQPDATIRYKANDDYYLGRAPLDNLVFSITPDASVRFAKLQAGECHVMPFTSRYAT